MKSETLPVWAWTLLVLLVLSQGLWIFKNARGRGKGLSAWLWGMWGMINFPTPLVVYLLVVVWPEARRKRAGRPPQSSE
ncbi:hypothetical protein [Paenibacillus sp. DYY-L-2]|uniref:hypothetical protein n=1 Tax=Paenibacillus sp. DYY-L-2 TaxID=3447013 RepID=UPI003F4F593C